MRHLLLTASAGIAALAAFVSAPAAAQLVDARNPKALFNLSKEEGYGPEMIHKKGEAPSFRIDVDGVKSLILFMDCDSAQANCKTIQFYAGYDYDEPFSTERINEWNRDKRFARAYVDASGDPVIEMDLDLDFGGLPRANVVEAFNLWRSLVGTFANFLSGEEEPAVTADPV